MSQRVVRYEGEGKHRRPVYADEGGSSAAASDAMAMHSRLTIPGLLGAPSGGAGPIERRQISEAERALRAEARPSPLAPRPRPAAEPDVAAEPAHIVSAELPLEDLGATLGVLTDALLEALEAHGDLLTTEQHLGAARIRWTQARAALDAAYRALDDPPPVIEPTEDPDYLPSGVSRVDPARVLEGSPAAALVHALVDAQAESERENIPEPIPVAEPPGAVDEVHVWEAGWEARAAAAPDDVVEPDPKPEPHVTGGGPGVRVLGHQQARVLAAVIKHHGDRKAAAIELGTSDNNVTTTLHHIGRKGLLPIELIPQLPAAFAKYRGA